MNGLRTLSTPVALSTVLVSVLASGCSGGFGSYGVTPGGAQDIDYARTVIEQGWVPRDGQFTAEGLFSQHDMPAPKLGTCEELLCPRAALAKVEPVDGSGEQVLVHLGFDTSIVALEREDLNLALVVDISGSMEGEKFASTKLALHTLVDQLGDQDRVALVQFDNEAHLVMASTGMDASGRAAVHARIDALETDGGTNIEAGLELGYGAIMAFADGQAGHEDRVMLFTDAQPNVGATDADSFIGQARAAAEQGVGLSVFGVGLDLGAELAAKVSEVRGGNSFYLADADAIATVFDDELDTIVTPIAYDLHFTLRPHTAFSFKQAYGTPDANLLGEVEVSVATAFVSKRGGAMAVMLDGDLDEVSPGQSVTSFSLEYEALDGSIHSELFEAEWLGGALPISEVGAADHAGVAKLAVLVDEFLALEAAAEACEGSLQEQDALARIEEARVRLADMAELLDDQPLRDEAELMDKLADNLRGDGCGW